MARRLRSQANSLYGTPQPLTSLDLIPVSFPRAPTTLDVGFTIGQLWYDSVGNIEYVLTSRAAGVATWTAITANAGAVFTITGSAGGALSPAAGDMIIAAGTNIASTSGAGHTITINGSSTPTFTTATTGKLVVTSASGYSGTTVAMIAGTTTVLTALVAAADTICLSANTPAGAQGALYVSAVTPGVSFVITSTSATDTSTVNWTLIKHA